MQRQQLFGQITQLCIKFRCRDVDTTGTNPGYIKLLLSLTARVVEMMIFVIMVWL
jgi:hydrogenase maturation factor